jgi:hypothetical protein
LISDLSPLSLPHIDQKAINHCLEQRFVHTRLMQIKRLPWPPWLIATGGETSRQMPSGAPLARPDGPYLPGR